MPRLFPASAVLVLLAFGAAATPAGAASTQLSAGLPFSDIEFSPSIPQISPDGAWAVYRQDAVTDGAAELWSVPVAGGEPVRLSEVLSPGQFLTFAISPNSERVVYTVAQDLATSTELYSVRIDGRTASIKLNDDFGPNRNVIRFGISPASDRVYYISDEAIDQKYELYGVSITGGNAERLNADLNTSDYDVDFFRISPDGQTVVYHAGQTSSGFWELWSVPAHGPRDLAAKINRNLNVGGSVDAYFEISPDSDTVVYRADAITNGTYNLYRVPIGDGLSVLINSGASVDTVFKISPDGGSVVYRAGSEATQIYNLYSADLSGGTPVQLNTILGVNESVSTSFQISQNTDKVVYRSDEETDGLDELWSVPLTGGTPVKLNGTLVGSGDVLDFSISPDGTRVVYLADQSVDTLNELWSVPIGGGAVTKLNRTLPSGGDVQVFKISPNGAWVVYGADQDTDLVDELLRAPIAGGAVENVSGPLASGGDVTLKYVQTTAFEVSPLNSYDVLYAADERVNNQIELFVSGEPYVDQPDACTPDETTLCLQNDKFKVSVTWRDFQDRSGSGRATQLSNESGDFWFFNAQSNELIAKIIDGCASTGNYWVFWRALSNVEMELVIRNTETLQTLTYRNPLGYNSNGHLDIDTIFRCDGSGPATEIIDTATALPAPGAPELIERVDPVLITPCIPDGDRVICLRGGRFRVQGTWSDFSGGSGYAHLIKKNEGSGYAWFFNANNYEMLFKLVDACSFNGNTWVSIAGLTNVAASLTITDTWTGTVYSQQNDLAVDFPTNLDIDTNLTYCGSSPF